MSVLKRMKLVLTCNCREASRLLSDRTERRLALHERMALRVHLAICRGCRRFRAYLRVLDSALAGEGGAEDDGQTAALLSSVEDDAALTEDARRRLKARLEQA